MLFDPLLARNNGLTPPATPRKAKGAITDRATFPLKPLRLVKVSVVEFAPFLGTFIDAKPATIEKSGTDDTPTVSWTLRFRTCGSSDRENIAARRSTVSGGDC